MKLTEESLNLVIDILNDLICEGKMLNDVERRSLLNAVMAITAVKERSVVSVSSRKEQSKKEKKEREIDPRFPNAGVAWNEADESLLRDVLEDVPDDEIGKHLFWLAEKLGRTPDESPNDFGKNH
ncbi:DNA-binding protein [Escherichia coli]|uniref:DNA-binding protein n=1 Tax=Escherichia coli TaxID=562 RepID=UPI003CE8AA5D